MPERLSSKSNPLVRRAKLLGAEASARRQEGALLAEGVRLVEEALEAGTPAEQIFHSPRLVSSERGRALLRRLETARRPLFETTDGVLESISDAETSQGIVGVFRTPALPSIPGAEERPGTETFWVVGWGLQDPGNVGTLLRTAHAAGASLFLTVAGSADPTAPKSVRASAGSIFRMPLVRGLEPDAILDTAAARGIRLFGTAPTASVPYDDPDYGGPIGFVFGREGEGLPPAVLEKLHRSIRIPMAGGVESINVAAAAAVVLFEAARRRRA